MYSILPDPIYIKLFGIFMQRRKLKILLSSNCRGMATPAGFDLMKIFWCWANTTLSYFHSRPMPILYRYENYPSASAYIAPLQQHAHTDCVCVCVDWTKGPLSAGWRKLIQQIAGGLRPAPRPAPLQSQPVHIHWRYLLQTRA